MLEEKKSKKLFVVANRLPVSITLHSKEKYEYKKSPGGLVSALSALKGEYKTCWIGWPGVMDPEGLDTQKITRELQENYSAYPIFLNRRQINHFYLAYSNGVLWPVLHYLPDHTLYDERSYLIYKKVNHIFAKTILKLLEEWGKDTYIWIQDYQLMLLPKILREEAPNLRIGFFLHTPFPSSELFRTLAYREELLQGLLGANLIGFHTFNYQRHFTSSLLHILGIEGEFFKVRQDTHICHLGTFPIGVDMENIRDLLENKAENYDKYWQYVQNIKKGRKMILCVDRLDYTKGIPDRLRAYRKFLQRNPELVKKVVLVQIAVPSRVDIRDYQALKFQVEESVRKIEEDFEHEEFSPIRFLYRSFSFVRLSVFYKEADIALVTPYFDGMNLVSKEYVAVKKDEGILILSERAGAAYELGEALLVNPWNSDQICEAIETALKMDKGEQKRRMLGMYEKLERNDVHYWSTSFLKTLEEIETEPKALTFFLSESIQKEILNSSAKASKKLFLLDYDGTLAEITNLPMNAKPDKELLKLLANLSQDPSSDVAIVTGRKKDDIFSWLGHLDLIFSVEHGLRIKWLGKKNWYLMVPNSSVGSWYGDVYEIFEHYNRTTPGSFIESKEASLAWHYRMVDPSLGRWKANELKIHLQNVLANHPLEVVGGKMVIEVRLQGVNKGNIFQYCKQFGYQYDFIIAIGDDLTDEYMFSQIPLSSVGIKVGTSYTIAPYYLSSVKEVRSFLGKFISNIDPLGL